jgi:PIN domain
MIYCDPSFLFSLYAWDDNTGAALKAYSMDRRRPLIFTPWQRFETRNAVRLAAHKLRRTGKTVPFQPGNVFKRMDQDLAAGILKHQEPDPSDTHRLVEDLSSAHTESLGSAAVDLWHVAQAIVLGAEIFWTFDADQRRLARIIRKFRIVL